MFLNHTYDEAVSRNPPFPLSPTSRTLVFWVLQHQEGLVPASIDEERAVHVKRQAGANGRIL